MKIKIKDVAFESNAEKGTAKLITPYCTTEYANALEAWNAFWNCSQREYEKQLRDELETHGFSRWTGMKAGGDDI